MKPHHSFIKMKCLYLSLLGHYSNVSGHTRPFVKLHKPGIDTGGKVATVKPASQTRKSQETVLTTLPFPFRKELDTGHIIQREHTTVTLDYKNEPSVSCFGFQWVREEDPHIMCLQEIKCAEKLLPPDVKDMPEYPHKYWACPDEKEGYSGVAMLCKDKPLNVTYGIGIEEHDKEGRVITAEFDSFFLIAAYVPNSSRGLVRLDYRQRWDVDFRAYLKGLDSKKPLILCGDLNVAHQEIDLKNPKTNKKTPGFTPQERQGFGELLAEGYLDSFRELYPDKPSAYTFWTYMMNARAKNVGWRLDYFVLSKALRPALCDSKIRSKVMGSDHCPITLLMAI